MTGWTYLHMDVFSARPFGGNPLPVFMDARGLDGEAMLAITRELRHFESIFLEPADAAGRVRARVFDLVEELPFAGHPLLGAAAALQSLSGRDGPDTWTFDLAGRLAPVTVSRAGAGFDGLLDQGAPAFLGETQDRAGWAAVFGLTTGDLRPDLPLAVASTGLKYLVLPLMPGSIARARVAADLSERLAGIGAQYAVLLDEAALEIRHWTNDGLMEDTATGSAAGVVGAYRLRQGLARAGEAFTLSQGRFTGRPSALRVVAEGQPKAVRTVRVGGAAVVVGRGAIEARP